MIRRPLTSIELKSDDLEEFWVAKKQQQQLAAGAGAGAQTSAAESSGGPSLASKSPIYIGGGQKSLKEIHERIGLALQQQRKDPAS